MTGDLERRVRDVLVKTTENDRFATVETGTDLFTLGINSVLFIRTIVGFEREFAIEFEDEALDYNEFNTLEKLIRYIEGRLLATA